MSKFQTQVTLELFFGLQQKCLPAHELSRSKSGLSGTSNVWIIFAIVWCSYAFNNCICMRITDCNTLLLNPVVVRSHFNKGSHDHISHDELFSLIKGNWWWPWVTCLFNNWINADCFFVFDLLAMTFKPTWWITLTHNNQ